jgi:predicted RNase H-like HicB family nuclease
MKYAFPAIFEEDTQTKGAINVVFPDIMGAYTFGMGYEEAMVMAKDLLGALMELDEYKHIKPTPIEQVTTKFGKVMLVEVEK